MTQVPSDRPARAADREGLAALLGPFWSATKVGAELGLGEDELTVAAERGELLRLETADGAAVFPVAQFRRVDGVVQVRPGIRVMLQELRGQDSWSVGVLLITQTPEHGVSPYELERSGADEQTLAEFARAVRREWC